MKTEDRKDWQADPSQIRTVSVSCWSEAGTLMTAQMSPDQARDLIVRGRAFVISHEHVGMCD